MNIIKQKNISQLSTFGIGEKAEYYTNPSNCKEIIEALNWAKEKKLPYHIIAGGSNIIFPDNTLPGLLIQIKGGSFKKIGDNKIETDAGVSLQKIINLANSLGFKGLETLAGIPGTIGGAIVGNAGAYGNSISQIIKEVKIWDGKKIKTLNNKDCKFRYRNSIFKEKNFIVINAILEFKKDSPKELSEKSEEIIKTRKRKYSPNLKSPGSFFKNVLVKDLSQNILKKINQEKIIEGKIPAGYLLENVGAKGKKIGEIQVAKFHGNVIINKGKGTRKDVEKLSQNLKEKVFKKFGIKLEEEVRYL
jgi:UDP-N-acetylmuramate dehydrogenase